MYNYVLPNRELNYSKITKHVIVGIVLVFFMSVLFGSFGTIAAGERGIKLRFSRVVGVLSEGLYWKTPFIESVKNIDVKIQKDEVGVSAASKDLQTVTSSVAINFHLEPEAVGKLWTSVGSDFKQRLIDPVIQETSKSVTAKFTAEELITKREDVRAEIKILLKERLSEHGILVDEFNIINFDFSKSFNDAIEAKVTAEQSALAAKNKLEQVKFEAQQAIEQAAGKAKAIQIEGDALKSSPQVVELRYIEKWDGKMPIYWGGANPLVGLQSLSK